MEHEDYERRRRAELSGSIYSLLFLVIANLILYPYAFSIYMSGLMRRHETGRWTYSLGHYEASLAVMFLVELVIVMCFYRFGPLRMTVREMGLSLKVPRLRELGWGFLSGLCVYAASLPVLFRFERNSGLTELIIRNFYHLRIALIIVLYAALLPIASEIVHRGIIFKAYLESSSLASAVLLNAFVFALVWPVHNWIIGSLLGVVTAVLYHRFRGVASPIVANAVLTLGCAATLVWRALCNPRCVP